MGQGLRRPRRRSPSPSPPTSTGTHTEEETQERFVSGHNERQRQRQLQSPLQPQEVEYVTTEERHEYVQDDKVTSFTSSLEDYAVVERVNVYSDTLPESAHGSERSSSYYPPPSETSQQQQYQTTELRVENLLGNAAVKSYPSEEHYVVVEPVERTNGGDAGVSAQSKSERSLRSSSPSNHTPSSSPSSSSWHTPMAEDTSSSLHNEFTLELQQHSIQISEPTINIFDQEVSCMSFASQAEERVEKRTKSDSGTSTESEGSSSGSSSNSHPPRSSPTSVPLRRRPSPAPSPYQHPTPESNSAASDRLVSGVETPTTSLSLSQ